MTGLDRPSPGTGVFHFTFVPTGTSHVVGIA